MLPYKQPAHFFPQHLRPEPDIYQRQYLSLSTEHQSHGCSEEDDESFAVRQVRWRSRGPQGTLSTNHTSVLKHVQESASLRRIEYHYFSKFWWAFVAASAWFQHVEVPVPSPKKGEVLLKLEAASINPIDWKIQKGMVRPFLPRKFPFIPGMFPRLHQYPSHDQCWLHEQLPEESPNIDPCGTTIYLPHVLCKLRVMLLFRLLFLFQPT